MRSSALYGSEVAVGVKGNVFVYESYEAGMLYGQDEFRITRDLIRRWVDIFGDSSSPELMPSGLVVLMQQQAYKKVIAPRPPGHVQGRQQFEVHSLAPLDSVVYTDVSCVSKEIRKQRRWVHMGFRGRLAGGVEVYSGVNTVLVPC